MDDDIPFGFHIEYLKNGVSEVVNDVVGVDFFEILKGFVAAGQVVDIGICIPALPNATAFP